MSLEATVPSPLGGGDDWIEDEIQRELDALDVNDLENDDESSINDNIVDFDEDVPDTVSAYLLHVQCRTECLTKELEECDQVLQHISADNKEFYYNSKELNELAFILGEDPEELRDRVINELEDEDSADVESSKQGEDESYLEQQQSDKYDTIEENGKVALILEADILEQAARKQVIELEEKHRARNMVAAKEREFQLQADARAEKELDKARQQVKKDNEKEQHEMIQTRKIRQEREKEELQEDTKKIEASLQQYEKEIQEFSKKMEEEKKVFDEELILRRAQKEQREKAAATVIQSVFRSYRTRKPYIKRIHKMREDLKERREQERQCEILSERRKEEQRKKKELMEKKCKQEEERRRKEELLRKEEEERQEAERKKKEKEEQERLEKERIEQEKLEKERIKREEEERARLELEKKEKEILAKIQAEKEQAEQDKKVKEMKGKQVEKVAAMNLVLNQDKKEDSDQQTQSEKNRNSNHIEDNNIKDDYKVEPLNQIPIDKELAITQEPGYSEGVPYELNSKTEDIPPCVNNLHSEKVSLDGKSLCATMDDVDVKNPLSQNAPNDLSSKLQDVAPNINNSKDNDMTVENNTGVKGISEFKLLPSLPDVLEAKRQTWIQNCVPFSKIQSQLKGSNQKIVQRQKRRPASAKKLQPLTTEQLLAASPLQTSLAQVTTVRLSDLPGCSLTSLNQCHDLVAMEFHNCNLVGLEGLENSENVKYIDVKNNQIEYINCKDREKLSSLNVSHNNLTVVHGLDGCSGLRRLDVSHNKISKLGCVASFSSLQLLDMSHNQLMTSQGLSSLALLQQLDLSNNHLSSIDDLENCCLLQKLNLSSNNLSQIPPLQNQVLLQELNVCNNSIIHLDSLEDCWLPCLRHLDISENSLEEILPSLHGLPFLSLLDVRHNLISEVDKLSGLELFKKLQHLHIEGNPVKEEQSLKSHVLTLLPSLQYLDSEQIKRDNSVDQCVTQFEASCESQINFQKSLNVKWCRELEIVKGDLVKLADIEQSHLEQMEKVMKDHRYMHEYGDTTVIEPEPVVASQVAATDHVTANHRINPPASVDAADGIKDCIIKESLESSDVKRRGSNDIRTGVVTTKAFIQQTQAKRHTDHAATIIQAYWRGHCIRRDIRVHSQRWLAAVTIQTCWRGALAKNRVRLMRNAIGLEGHEVNAMKIVAATMIQAWWRGIRTRYLIHKARQQAVMDVEDDFFYDEIDLSSFDYIESDWRPADEPQLPQSHPTLPSHPTQHHPSPPTKERPPSSTVRHAWRNINSPQQYSETSADVLIVEDSNTPRSAYSETRLDTDRNTPTGKPPLPPLSGLSGSTLKTSRSEKEEQISEEWGFKDGTTAALMMKRARKMRGKKKVDDPLQRFKMIKKLQDTSRKEPIQLSKKGVQRKEYFQGRAEEIAKQEQAPQKAIEEKNRRTFEWLHAQVDNPSDPRFNTKGMMGRHATSEPSLPRMSPDVLQGRVQLVASPSLELQSVDSRSTVSTLSLRHRSHSFSSPDGSKIQLSTIKTNSAPTNHTRQRLEAKAKHRGHYKY